MKQTGPPAIALPNDQDSSGRSLGAEELALLQRVIESGTLTSTKGTMVKELERRFALRFEMPRAFACTSGTAAIHCAVAALDPEPGDEIVTTSITDMGALTPILYQSAIPVFADVEPHTLNVTAETIARCLSPRTRAILVTHLFGNPCAMGPILQLAAARGLPVIEDCAQAYLARSSGRLVGTLGAIGCFSLQQGKHMTSGEGGLLVCRNPALARRIALFINKAWPYGEPDPDHEFLALNYRMPEPVGAVALAQFEKLDASVTRRVAMAARLTARLEALPGLETPPIAPGDVHAFWRYAVRVDPSRIAGGAPGLGARLSGLGVLCQPRYIKKPAFECRIFREQRTFGKSRFPFALARPEALDYSREKFPGTYDGLEQILVMPWNERYDEVHVDFIAGAFEAAIAELAGGR